MNPIRIKEMFNKISLRYDFLNYLMTFGLIDSWRKTLNHQLKDLKKEKIIDLATGTGEQAFLAKKTYPSSCVFGVDFSHSMLEIAEQKKKKNELKVDFSLEDITQMPFESNFFDLAMISYGIRNIPDRLKALKEIQRVLKKDAYFFILETGAPKGFFKFFLNFHFSYIVPFLGKIFSSHFKAYHYLNETSQNFPARKDFVEELKKSLLFKEISSKTLFFGASYLYSMKVSKN